MKIFSNNKVYVQNNDLVYFMRGIEGISVPSSIFDKVFGQVFIVTDENRYEFVEFSQPEEVEFFRKCDWMVDYNYFDGMSEEEMVTYGCKINEERNDVVQQYNNLPVEEKEKKFMETSLRVELLEFKMWSVRDVLWHHQGYLQFPLPDGVDDSYLINNNEQEMINNTKKIEKENIIQKILRRKRKK